MRRLTLTLCVVSALTAGTGAVGYVIGREVPFVEQWPVYDGLRQTASIVFGITGAWAAIVYPGAIANLVKGTGRLTGEEERSVHRLLVPMVLSAMILIALLALAYCVPLARRVPLLTGISGIVRGTSFAFLAVLTCMEAMAVVFMLVPLDNAKGDVDSRAAQRRAMDALLPRDSSGR